MDEKMKTSEQNVNSHIQMPKVLLRRFHNCNNRFFYYDVVGGFIGNKGTAESLNTEWGYYSIPTEHFFRDKIETPFGKILSYIEKNRIDQDVFAISTSIQQITLDFLYALVARSPGFLQQMKTGDSFIENLSPQEQHDFVAKSGIGIAKEHKIFSDYIVTFMINNTSIPFVLSNDGLYNYELNGHSVINLPISPKVVISLIHKSYSHRVLRQDGLVSMFAINEPDKIMFMNAIAFSAQIKRNWGYIICPERGELDRLMNEQRISDQKE